MNYNKKITYTSEKITIPLNEQPHRLSYLQNNYDNLWNHNYVYFYTNEAYDFEYFVNTNFFFSSLMTDTHSKTIYFQALNFF